MARARPTIFEVAGEALDVDPMDVEQTPVVLPAPRRELAQIEGVGLPGEASVPGEEAEQRRLLDLGQERLVALEGHGGGHGGGSLQQGRSPLARRKRSCDRRNQGPYEPSPVPWGGVGEVRVHR